MKRNSPYTYKETVHLSQSKVILRSSTYSSWFYCDIFAVELALFKILFAFQLPHVCIVIKIRNMYINNQT